MTWQVIFIHHRDSMINIVVDSSYWLYSRTFTWLRFILLSSKSIRYNYIRKQPEKIRFVNGKFDA